MLTITVDTRDAKRMLAGIKNGLPRAMRDTLNDTAGHIRTLASKDIRDKWNVKKKDLDPRLKITKATVNRQVASVEALGEPIPLIIFGAKKVRQGVSVALIKGQRTTIKGGFIATMQSGHTGVFTRRYKSRRQGRPYRELPIRTVKSGAWAGTIYRPALPILESHTVTTATMWNKHIAKHKKQAEQYAVRRLPYFIERQLARARK